MIKQVNSLFVYRKETLSIILKRTHRKKYGPDTLKLDTWPSWTDTDLTIWNWTLGLLERMTIWNRNERRHRQKYWPDNLKLGIWPSWTDFFHSKIQSSGYRRNRSKAGSSKITKGDLFQHNVYLCCWDRLITTRNFIEVLICKHVNRNYKEKKLCRTNRLKIVEQ